MKEYQKEILKLSAQEVLSSIFDLALPFFESHRLYRVSAKKYSNQRISEHASFSERIRYLKKQGLITNFVEGKEEYLELTPSGLLRARRVKARALSIERPQQWDGKWRLVVYDVPKKYDNERGYFRSDLIKHGFRKIQESVYVHPFECTQQVRLLAAYLNISQYVLITISDIIQGEQKLIEDFLSDKILDLHDLKQQK